MFEFYFVYNIAPPLLADTILQLVFLCLVIGLVKS